MSALVAAALSWFDTSTIPWTTLTCWYCGIFTGLTLVGTSGLQALGFRNMKQVLDYEDMMRTSLGTGTLDARNQANWEANYGYIYVSTLKTTFILFGLGLELGMWDAAIKEKCSWASSEMKVIAFYYPHSKT